MTEVYTYLHQMRWKLSTFRVDTFEEVLLLRFFIDKNFCTLLVQMIVNRWNKFPFLE